MPASRESPFPMALPNRAQKESLNRALLFRRSNVDFIIFLTDNSLFRNQAPPLLDRLLRTVLHDDEPVARYHVSEPRSTALGRSPNALRSVPSGRVHREGCRDCVTRRIIRPIAEVHSERASAKAPAALYRMRIFPELRGRGLGPEIHKHCPVTASVVAKPSLLAGPFKRSCCSIA